MSDTYDPAAPEGEITSRGSYVTGRELRALIIVGVLALVAFLPIYTIFKGKTDRARCTANMQAMFDAMGLYAEQHDGRYPPIDRSETPGSLVPSLGETGHVYTWASDIAGYMSARASFLCPSANPEEIVQTEDPRSGSKTLPLSYGMYAPYGGYLVSLVENPDQTVIVAETSNRGSNHTYDPLPFTSLTGQPLPDGFVICWNDSNDNGDAASKTVTRLAFPGTDAGVFAKGGDARHGDAIHMLTATGERVNSNQLSSIFHHGKLVSPLWTLPPITQRSQ
jgi:Tfp pilus assembly protein PilE